MRQILHVCWKTVSAGFRASSTVGFMIDLRLGLSDVGTDNGPTAAGLLPRLRCRSANGSALSKFNAGRARGR